MAKEKKKTVQKESFKTGRRKKPDESRKAVSSVLPVENRPSKPDGDFPIVGISASAGGLEAFEQFFTHTPPDSGAAFVLIPHLDPSMVLEP